MQLPIFFFLGETERCPVAKRIGRQTRVADPSWSGHTQNWTSGFSALQLAVSQIKRRKIVYFWDPNNNNIATAKWTFFPFGEKKCQLAQEKSLAIFPAGQFGKLEQVIKLFQRRRRVSYLHKGELINQSEGTGSRTEKRRLLNSRVSQMEKEIFGSGSDGGNQSACC